MGASHFFAGDICTQKMGKAGKGHVTCTCRHAPFVKVTFILILHTHEVMHMKFRKGVCVCASRGGSNKCAWAERFTEKAWAVPKVGGEELG